MHAGMHASAHGPGVGGLAGERPTHVRACSWAAVDCGTQPLPTSCPRVRYAAPQSLRAALIHACRLAARPMHQPVHACVRVCMGACRAGALIPNPHVSAACCWCQIRRARPCQGASCTMPLEACALPPPRPCRRVHRRHAICSLGASSPAGQPLPMPGPQAWLLQLRCPSCASRSTGGVLPPCALPALLHTARRHSGWLGAALPQGRCHKLCCSRWLGSSGALPTQQHARSPAATAAPVRPHCKREGARAEGGSDPNHPRLALTWRAKRAALWPGGVFLLLRVAGSPFAVGLYAGGGTSTSHVGMELHDMGGKCTHDTLTHFCYPLPRHD